MAGIGTRRQLNQAEAEHIAVAASKYLVGRLAGEDAPFTFDLAVRAAQRDVRAGVGVGRSATNLIPFWGKNPTSLIEDAAYLHFRAVKIHPFLNGNGRWSRMLANIWLREHGALPILWPEPQIGQTSPIRTAHIEAIKAADNNDHRQLVELHRRSQQPG